MRAVRFLLLALLLASGLGGAGMPVQAMDSDAHIAMSCHDVAPAGRKGEEGKQHPAAIGHLCIGCAVLPLRVAALPAAVETRQTIDTPAAPHGLSGLIPDTATPPPRFFA